MAIAAGSTATALVVGVAGVEARWAAEGVGGEGGGGAGVGIGWRGSWDRG